MSLISVLVDKYGPMEGIDLLPRVDKFYVRLFGYEAYGTEPYRLESINHLGMYVYISKHCYSLHFASKLAEGLIGNHFSFGIIVPEEEV